MERVPIVDSEYGNSRTVRGAGDGQLALRIGDAGEAGRSQHERERQRTAEERG